MGHGTESEPSTKENVQAAVRNASHSTGDQRPQNAGLEPLFEPARPSSRRLAIVRSGPSNPVVWGQKDAPLVDARSRLPLARRPAPGGVREASGRVTKVDGPARGLRPRKSHRSSIVVPRPPPAVASHPPRIIAYSSVLRFWLVAQRPETGRLANASLFCAFHTRRCRRGIFPLESRACVLRRSCDLSASSTCRSTAGPSLIRARSTSSSCPHHPPRLLPSLPLRLGLPSLISIPRSSQHIARVGNVPFHLRRSGSTVPPRHSASAS